MTTLDDARGALTAAQGTVVAAQKVVDDLFAGSPPPPPPPPTTALGRYGTANGWKLTVPAASGGRDTTGQDAEIALCADLGAKIVRIGQAPNTIQVADKLFKKGITPLILFGGNPTFPWAKSAAALAADAANLASRYGANAIYECLNEPTLHGWSPAAYVPYLHAFHDAVKAGAPSATVLMAGLFSSTLVTWVKGFIAAGGLAYTDAINVHLYDDAAEHGAWSQWDMTFGSGGAGFYDTDNVCSNGDAWAKANGKPSLPVVSTESGGPVPKYSESKQAAIVNNALRAADGIGLGYRRTMFTLIYNVYDDDVAGFGMLRPDRSKRPSFAAFQAVAKA